MAAFGFLEAVTTWHAGEIPLILKLDNHDVPHDQKDPLSAITGSMRDTLRLGCVGIGFSICPASANVRSCTRSCAVWPRKPRRQASPWWCCAVCAAPA